MARMNRDIEAVAGFQILGKVTVATTSSSINKSEPSGDSACWDGWSFGDPLGGRADIHIHGEG